MIDLSNNNHGTVDFKKVRKQHHRVYLKLTEGVSFADATFAERRAAAYKAGMLVGAYHFARPSRNDPELEAEWFVGHLPDTLKAGRDLRPCLDLEDPKIPATPAIRDWAEAFIVAVQRDTRHIVVLYSYPSYLGGCRFEKAHPLWLASYGRNDGKEYAYRAPAPWDHVAAHQYTSLGVVPGVPGRCDVSRVFKPAELDVATTG